MQADPKRLQYSIVVAAAFYPPERRRYWRTIADPCWVNGDGSALGLQHVCLFLFFSLLAWRMSVPRPARSCG